MPQNNLFLVAKKSNGALVPMVMDGGTGSLLLVTGGGNTPAYNLTAAAVIKATPGRLCRIVVSAPGTTSGAFTFNDCATTGAAAAANQIFTIAYNATANVAGAVFTLDWPCNTGIVLSAVPGGGSPVVSVSFV